MVLFFSVNTDVICNRYWILSINGARAGDSMLTLLHAFPESSTFPFDFVCLKIEKKSIKI